jgi:hypothetical protein
LTSVYKALFDTLYGRDLLEFAGFPHPLLSNNIIIMIPNPMSDWTELNVIYNTYYKIEDNI